jgi:hypothetical protein
VRYGSTWGARRGGSGGTEGFVEFDGITEYITEAYVWHGSYFDSLLFKTNRGRTVGGLKTAETDPSGEINAQVTLCVQGFHAASLHGHGAAGLPSWQ